MRKRFTIYESTMLSFIFLISTTINLFSQSFSFKETIYDAGSHPDGYTFSIPVEVTNLTGDVLHIETYFPIQTTWVYIDPNPFDLSAYQIKTIYLKGSFNSQYATNNALMETFGFKLNGNFVTQGIVITGMIDNNTSILSINQTDFDLGTRELGDYFTFDFTIKNTGGGTLSGYCASFDTYSIENGNFNLTSNQSQTVTVKLYATQLGQRSGTVNVNANAGQGHVYFHYNVEDPLPPKLNIDKQLISIGKLNKNQDFTGSFNISNIGGGNLSGTINSISQLISSIQPTSFSIYSTPKSISFTGKTPITYGPFKAAILITSNGGNDSLIVQGEVDDSVKNGVVLFNGFDYRFKAPLTQGVDYYKFIFDFVDSTSSKVPIYFNNNKREIVSSENTFTLTANLLNDFTPAKYYWQVFDNNDNPLTSKYVFLKVNLIPPSNTNLQPIILLHGWNSDGKIWEGDANWYGLKGELENLGYSPWILEYPNFGNIRESAWALGIAIDSVLLRSSSSYSKVDILSHSMGGLVARAYTVGLARDLGNKISAYKNDIKYLAFLATPHWGEKFALYAALLKAIGVININQYAIRQLTPMSTFILDLNSHPLNQNIKYLAIGGYDNRWTHYCKSSGWPVTKALAPLVQGLDIGDVVVDLNSAIKGPAGFFDQFKIAFRNHSNILMNEDQYPASDLLPVLKDFFSTGRVVSDNIDVYNFAMLYGKMKNLGFISQPKLLKTSAEDPYMISGAEIQLFRENDPDPYIINSNKNGEFLFNFLQKGNYKIQTIADGFVSDSFNITLDDASLQYQKNILLRKDLSYSGPTQYSMTINNGELVTNLVTNNIKLDAQNSVAYMLSENADFTNSNWQTYTTDIIYSFNDQSEGIKTLFVKFKDASGNESKVIITSIEYKLQIKNAAIYITANIDGAEIILNGNKTGVFTPGIITGLSCGNYSISIKKSGYLVLPSTRLISLLDNQTYNVNFLMNLSKPNSPIILNSVFKNDTLSLKILSPSNSNLHKMFVSYLDGQFPQNPNDGNVLFDEITKNDTIVQIVKAGMNPNSRFFISAFAVDSNGINSLPANIILQANPSPWMQKAKMDLTNYWAGLIEFNGQIYAYAMRTLEVYYPELDKWEMKSELPNYSDPSTASIVFQNKIYFFGGYGFYNSVYEYDPSNDSYTQKASLIGNRLELHGVILNNSIYAIHIDTWASGTTVIEKYDSINDMWEIEDTLIIPLPKFVQYRKQGLTVFNNKLFIFSQNATQVYDPTNKEVIQKTPSPYVENNIDINAVTVNDKILVAIGKNLFEYDPILDSWRAKTEKPFEVRYGSMAALGKKLYCNGEDGTFYVYDIQLDTYDPISNIVFTDPTSNEIWKNNSFHLIKWTSYNVSKLNIEYRTNNGNWIPIASNIPANQLNYLWHLPDVGSAICQIRAFDSQNPNVSIESNLIQIDENYTTDDWEILHFDSAVTTICYNKVSGNIFAATHNGVYRSSDGGKNWTNKSNGLYPLRYFWQYYTSLDVDSDGNLFIGLNWSDRLYYYVYRSTDNGESWHMILDYHWYKYFSFLINNTDYYAISGEGILHSSSSLFPAWYSLPFEKPQNAEVYYPAMDNHKNLYLDLTKSSSEDSSGIFVLSPGNQTMKQIYKKQPSQVQTPIIINSNDQIFYLEPNNLITSTDYGNTWKKIGEKTNESSKMITLSNNQIILTNNSGVFYSKDNGLFWEDKSKGWIFSNTNNSIVSDKDGYIYLGSDLGVIKSTRPFINEISNVSSTIIACDFSLSQNYPNPFNPLTNIEFSLPKESRVELLIYDILGQKISTIVNEELKAGKHRYEWNASKYASGVYFYNLRANDFNQTKKMILLK